MTRSPLLLLLGFLCNVFIAPSLFPFEYCGAFSILSENHHWSTRSKRKQNLSRSPKALRQSANEIASPNITMSSSSWNPDDFELQVPKPRYMNKTHAIQGSLWGDSMIRAYDIYKPKDLVIPSNDGTEINRLVLVAKVDFGTHLNGHGGVVHGGILSLMFDDAMGWGCDVVLPKTKTPVTANLNVNFRKPCLEDTQVELHVILERWERRKLFWKARMVDAQAREEDGEQVLYAEATSLYIVLKDDK